jgi:hypothetical protein
MKNTRYDPSLLRKGYAHPRIAFAKQSPAYEMQNEEDHDPTLPPFHRRGVLALSGALRYRGIASRQRTFNASLAIKTTGFQSGDR